MLNRLEPTQRQSISDVVFDTLHKQIILLEMPPGMKLSETTVASALGTSRQPVRDAFYRLSQLGFIQIRPQRATIISPISISAVMQARYIRMAIEIENIRHACQRINDNNLNELETLIEDQRQAIEENDLVHFHQLDEIFHQKICEYSGASFSWNIIRIHKAHMDRVRLLSLVFATSYALADHGDILSALRARDQHLAENAMRRHLSRIDEQIERIQEDNPSYFSEE